MIIETNITYGQQICSMCIGGVAGAGIVVHWLYKFIIILLGFYAVYKISQIVLQVFSRKKKKREKK